MSQPDFQGADPLDTTEEDEYYYHVAPRRLRDEISAYGMDIEGMMERNHTWCDRGIYMWGTLPLARQWAKSHCGFSGPADIWQIHPDGVEDAYEDPYAEARPDLPHYQDSYVTLEPIDPEYLTLLTDTTAEEGVEKRSQNV